MHSPRRLSRMGRAGITAIWCNLYHHVDRDIVLNLGLPGAAGGRGFCSLVFWTTMRLVLTYTHRIKLDPGKENIDVLNLSYSFI